MEDVDGKRERIESVFGNYGIADFKWIDPRDIVVAQWVRAKCMFGCANYGKRACCPPNSPSIPECKQFFSEYEAGVIFHFARVLDNFEDHRAWTRPVNQALLAAERDVFLLGHEKAFLLPMSTCNLCEECTAALEDCKNPKSARPTPESMGIDVYSTARKHGFPIQVLADYSGTVNRYAFLLVE
jgi:predicted metal-binding protein